MDIKDIKTAYFLGIGGIGMSAIARYFKHLGIKVMGYDKTPTTLTNELIKEGIDIHFEDLGDNIQHSTFNIQNSTFNIQKCTSYKKLYLLFLPCLLWCRRFIWQLLRM